VWLLASRVDGFHCPDALLNRGHDGCGIEVRTNNQVNTDGDACLVEGCVNQWFWLLAQIGVADVRGYTDDFAPDGVSGFLSRRQPFADNINRAKVFSRESFVDDENERMFRGIRAGKIAACQ